MHISNYTRAQKGHILTHCENAEVRAKLKNVSSELTKDNYNLCSRENIKAIDYWEKRYKESKHSNQKKTAVMTDIVLTQPKQTMTPEQSREFFEQSYKFLSERYGTENIISAWVHLDEPDAQPHLHLCLLPINKETNRCSARGIFSKEELQKVHIELQKYLDEHLDFDCPVMNGATANGNKTIQQLKSETNEKELQELTEKIQQQKQIYSFLKKQVEELKDENLKEETRNRAIKQVYNDVKDRLTLEKENKELKEKLKDTVSKDEYNELVKEYNEIVKLGQALEKYIKNRNLEQDFYKYERERTQTEKDR